MSSTDWTEGMLAVPRGYPEGRRYRITAIDSTGGMAGVEVGCTSYPRTWGLDGLDSMGPMNPAEWEPDLTDPATIGCLQALKSRQQ